MLISKDRTVPKEKKLGAYKRRITEKILEEEGMKRNVDEGPMACR